MIVDMKKVTTAMVMPRAGCSSFCQGAFSQATTQDGASHEAMAANIMKVVDEQLGAVARPARVRFVTALPKTRSGKVLRRAIVSVCEGRDPGDLTTIEDPSALEQIKDSL